ncbi:unannotated protein [freshwater metagenome]|uniref:Unannotated protein n=1 Tax=freshwater metagenome TaxID=449393 RepID=A0A6J6C3S4_9ZZZZ
MANARASSTKSLFSFLGMRLIDVTPRFSSSAKTSCWRITAFLASTIACTSFAVKSFFIAIFTGAAFLTTAFLTGAAFLATAFFTGADFFAAAFLTGALFLTGAAFFAAAFFTGAAFFTTAFLITLFLSALNTATIVLWFLSASALMRWLYYNLSTGVNAHPKGQFRALFGEFESLANHISNRFHLYQEAIMAKWR